MSLQVNSLVASKAHMAGFDLSQELFKAAYDMAFYSDVSPLINASLSIVPATELILKVPSCNLFFS